VSPLDLCLGEDDKVVACVVAVRGLSFEPVIAAADEGGSFPVSSSFLILDFRSSNSSQTVEGAVVEIVDSVFVCSCILNRSAKWFSEPSLDRVW
jgi:hypothetical protein